MEFSVKRIAWMLLAASAGAASGGPIAALELTETALHARSQYGHAIDTSTSLEAALTLSPSLTAALGGSAELVVSARLRADAADELSPGIPAHATYSDASRPWTPGPAWTLDLRDLHIDWRPGTALVRIGKQQIVWGALDGLKVLDALNPQDFREFILADFGDSRIGLWSAYLELVGDSWRAELALIPDPTAHELPVAGAWFAFTAPRFRFGTAGNVAVPMRVQRPANPIEDGTAGLRLARFFGRTEVTLVAATGLDFEPVGRLDSVAGMPVLTRTYERRKLFGASIESAVGQLALRAEASWQPDKAFNVRLDDASQSAFLDVVDVDQYRAALAADANIPGGWFLNAQLLVDHLDDPPRGLVRPQTDRIATMFLRRRFDYDRIGVELRWYTEVDHHDELFRASLSWRPTENTELTLAVEAFSGEDDGVFGQFADADRVTLALERTF